jgi:hypothetical protein
MESMQEQLSNVPSMLDTEVTRIAQHQSEEVRGRSDYLPLPQTPSKSAIPCSITINYPAIIPSSSAHDGFICTAHQDPPPNEIHPFNNWALLPDKFQPPLFQVRPCRRGEIVPEEVVTAFKLPLGFPEIVQFIHEAPKDVSNVVFYCNVVHKRAVQPKRAVHPTELG